MLRELPKRPGCGLAMNSEADTERLAVRTRTASILSTLRAILAELSSLPETERRRELIASNRSMIEIMEKMLSSLDAEARGRADE
jgi:hypothetical protein